MFGKAFIAVVGVSTAWILSLDSWRILPKNDIPGMIAIFSGEEADSRRLDRSSFSEEIKDYDRKQNTEGARDIEMVNQYYNMATDFYEYGWGHSFHFAHTLKNEGHHESIARHEDRLADLLRLKPGMNVIDCGCGVGGPAREIARYSGAHVKGVTLNNYQVARAKKLSQNSPISHLVEFEQGDFTKLQDANESLDAAYAIEATCHSPTLEMVYGEIHRVLKKGGLFASYEWITTDRYDANNATHQEICKEIEYGNGLPPLRSKADVERAAEAVGFRLVHEKDLALDHVGTRPWYSRLDLSTWEYYITHATCYLFELFGVADEGTLSIHGMLLRAADGLVRGGKEEIFTPIHVFVFEKI